MNLKNELLILLFALVFTACQSGTVANSNAITANNANSNAPANTKANVAGEPKVSEAKPPVIMSSAPDTEEAVKFPFENFPKTDTTAKAGEYVLVPSHKWLKDAAEKGADTTTFIWYMAKMAEPGKENSEVQFQSERKKVPNAYIVSIPPKQTAKKGDIILTWWQTGSGLQRAIVVDDKDPISPVVRYLDIDYDNPAMSGDKVTTIGKMDEKIVPDSFIKIKDWDAGTSLVIADGANMKIAKLIRAAGDKVFVLERAGRIAVYPKASAKPIPIVPNVKEGDRVKAPFVGTFKDATVTRVDALIGRVFIKFDGMPDEKAIAFGDVLKN